MTNVRFAVLQISCVVISGLVGALVPQIPTAALHDPSAYASQIADMHTRYDPLSILGFNVGPGMVDLFERLGFFQVFNTPWFVGLLALLAVSITVCTLDRTPRLWYGVRRITVEQPPEFFDLRLAERARFAGASLSADDVSQILRRKHFKVRRVKANDGAVEWVYGDRNQYFKMATLLTHLGLILFLAGGAITAAFGFETVVFVGEGQTAPVQPVGTPHDLLVKNIHFDAPQRADGSFEDFSTDLAVYQDGVEIARKTIRVNDPLQVGGFVFHQNTFGPSANIDVRDSTGQLVWTGPVILAGQFLGLPQGFLTIPGSTIGLLLVIETDASGMPILAVSGLGPSAADGSSDIVFESVLAVGTTSEPSQTAGYSITWDGTGAWTGMVVKNDPGAPIIWIAFMCLIAGLILSFYFPRRRVWGRFESSGLSVAMLADRYVDGKREFDALLDVLAGRGGGTPERGSFSAPPAPSASPSPSP